MKAIALLAALAAVPATAQAPSAPTLQPVAVAAALDEFAALCLATFPRGNRFRAAVGRSSAGYVADGAAWRSPRAHVSFEAGGGDTAPRCAIDAWLDETLDTGVVAGLVEGRIARTLNAVPERRQIGRTIVWDWAEDATAHRVTFDFGSSLKSRQLALSIERVRPGG